MLRRVYHKINNDTIYRDDNIQRFFVDINNPKYKPLDDEVIRSMFETDRQKYKERIINANIRFVVTIAKNYDNGESIMDFTNEGIEGLLEAFERYDPKSEAKFSSYAVWWIKAKMSDFVLKRNMVQKPYQRKLGSKALKFRERFLLENEREATIDEIKDFLMEDIGYVPKSEDEIYGLSVTSINESLGGSDGDDDKEAFGEYALLTACDNDYNATIENDALANDLEKMMKCLSERDKEIIIRHIYNDESMYEIAMDMEMSKERVRQIITAGLEKMKSSEYAKKFFSRYL
jgi:RNA polymerase sigma factor (sigma-70 family)